MTTYSNPQRIKGKWHGREYNIQRTLGKGANGIVYLALHNDQPYALKVGEDSHSIAAEVNVLRHFQKAQGRILGPSVFDVDDWESGGKTKSFYVMNVIDGIKVELFIQRQGQEWIPILIIQLLDFLQELHQKGWVFGDLKPDNLKVTLSPPRLAWFDAGGITRMGRAVKEYTEWFDRGYWGMGHRKAEPSYDLFSVSMIMIYLYTGTQLFSLERSWAAWRKTLEGTKPLSPYKRILSQAFNGNYTSAQAMKNDLLTVWHRVEIQQKSKRTPEYRTNGETDSSGYRKQKERNRKRVGDRMISFFFLISFLLFLFALYLFSRSV